MDLKIYSPVRIDLAGGTLDLEPMYQFFYPTIFSTINLAINPGITIEFKQRSDMKINIIINGEIMLKINSFDEIAAVDAKKPNLSIFLRPLIYFNLEFGIDIIVDNPIPLGSGLGTSSSILVNLVKGLSLIKELKLTDEEILLISKGIETSILKIPTGKQDYIAPLKGGLNQIYHQLENEKIDKITLTNQLKDHFSKYTALYYLHKPNRFTNSIENSNWNVFKQVVEGNEEIKNYLLEINDICTLMGKSLIDNDLPKFRKLFTQENKIRSKLFPNIISMKTISLLSNYNIDEFGIMGAGGGGCIMIFNDKIDLIKSKLLHDNLKLIKYSINEEGLKIIKSKS